MNKDWIAKGAGILLLCAIVFVGAPLLFTGAEQTASVWAVDQLPTPVVTPGDGEKLEYAKSEGECRDETSEWHWVITDVTEQTAPQQIYVVWIHPDGSLETVELLQVTGSVGHYSTMSHGPIDLTPVAYAILPGNWEGQFNLSHRPCAAPTATATETATETPTDTPTDTPTNTATETASETPTETATETPTSTATETATTTPSSSATATETGTTTPTATGTATQTPTESPSISPTVTETPTATQTGTQTATATPTSTPTGTSVTETGTPTNTATDTQTPTPTLIETVVTSTSTPTFTPTSTQATAVPTTPSSTPTNTTTPTATEALTPTSTPEFCWGSPNHVCIPVVLKPVDTATSTQTPTPVVQWCGAAFALDPAAKTLTCSATPPGLANIDWHEPYVHVGNGITGWKDAAVDSSNVVHIEVLINYFKNGPLTYIEALKVDGVAISVANGNAHQDIVTDSFWLYVRERGFRDADGKRYPALEVQFYPAPGMTGLFVTWLTEAQSTQPASVETTEYSAIEQPQ